MEAKTFDRIGNGSVFFVTDDGVAGILAVDPYLVFSSRFEFKSEAREVLAGGIDGEVGDGDFPFFGVIGGVDPISRIFVEVRGPFSLGSG